MISFIRENMKKAVAGMFVSVLAVILVIAFSQAPDIGQGRRNVEYGKIGNIPISRDEFNHNAQTVVQRLQYQQMLFGSKREIPQFMIISQTREMIESKYLSQRFAVNRDLQPSFEKLMEVIKESMSASQFSRGDGSIDFQAYTNYKNQLNRKGINLDNEMKRNYMQRFIYELIGRSILCGKQEVREYFRIADNKVKVGYFLASVENKRRIAYPENRIRQHYEKNKSRYMAVEDMYRASHILLKEGAKDARQNAEKALAEIKAGKITFADASRKYSHDNKVKDKGGDLGWFGKTRLPGQVTKPVLDALLKLKPGQVGPVVQSSMGFHVIQLTGSTKKGQTKTQEMVKDDIIAELNNLDMHNLHRRTFEKLQKEAPGADLKKLAKSYKTEYSENNEFSKLDFIYGLRDQETFKRAIFDPLIPLKKNTVIYSKDGIIVFRKLELNSFDEESFEKKFDTKLEEYKQRLIEFYYREWLSVQKKKVRIQWNLSEGRDS